MSEILQIRKGVGHIDDITSMQYHTYTPYTTSFKNNDEIRITIQSQDLYVQPSDSYLLIEFKATKRDGKPFGERGQDGFFTRLSALQFFSEMRYELNGVEIDRCKLPSLTAELKTMLACKTTDESHFQSMAWLNSLPITDMTYHLAIPLKFIFGFCDDYNKIVLNSKHELILMRDHSDTNAYMGLTDSIKFDILKIQWKIPHVTLSDQAKLGMLRTIGRGDTIPLAFRSWDLYELPSVPHTTRNIWSVKTTTQTTRPRYVVVAFQHNRNHIVGANPRHFDHCEITNLRLYLNNERYPYDDLNYNFNSPDGDFSEQVSLLANIQRDYYSGVHDANPNTIKQLLKDKQSAIFAFNCSRSDESVKTGMVDVRIEMDARQNFPTHTTAYCLIIHDTMIRYCPATGIVNRDSI